MDHFLSVCLSTCLSLSLSLYIIYIGKISRKLVTFILFHFILIFRYLVSVLQPYYISYFVSSFCDLHLSIHLGGNREYIF